MATKDLLQKAQSMLDQTKAEGTKKFAGSKFDTTKPITTDQLQPTQPFNLNLPRPQVPSSGLESAVTGSVEAYKAQGEQERAMREEAQKSSKNDLNNSINEIMGIQTEIGNVGNTIDRTMEDTARKEADRYTSEIEAEQLAVRRKIEALQKNPQGMTMGAIADESNRLERDSLSKQADLAILQNSALRNYTTAKDIADREVQNKLEPLKIKLENLKFFYAEHKEQFNKEDDRLYSEKIKDEQRAIDKEENLQNQISSIKLEAAKNGAPASVLNKLSQAKTFDEALIGAGQYASDYLGLAIKRATLNKTNAELTQLNNAINASKIPINTTGLPNTTAGFVTKLMASGANKKDLDATERQSLSKARTVIGQLDSLQTNISGQNKTGFIKGKTNNLLEKFGLNADVGVINAQLQAVVPNLARGTYGEVGVLTDNDIANYRKTLPRLDRPQDQNDAVMALTLKTVLNSIENTLSTASNSNINVSGWTNDYLTIKNKINEIEDRIGVSKTAVNELVAQDPNLAGVIKEMYQNNFTDGEILEFLNAR